MVVQTSAQSIPNNTETAITWNSAVTAPETSTPWWSSGQPSRITLPWAGPWFISGKIFWATNTSGRRAFHLNEGTTISSSSFVAGCGVSFNTSTNSGKMVNYDGILHLAATTYQLAAYQNSGGSLDTETQSPIGRSVQLSLTYLGT